MILSIINQYILVLYNDIMLYYDYMIRALFFTLKGIMFLTNDYEWHTVLAHPRYEMTRRYRIVVYNGAPDTARLQALQRGLQLPDEARPCLPLEDLGGATGNSGYSIF